MLKDHLGQLVKARYLKSSMQEVQQRGNPLSLSLGVIEVIHAASRSTAVTRKGVLAVVLIENYLDEQPLKKKIKFA